MKILQLLPELNIGGVERGTIDLAKILVEEGHKSFVISNGGRLVSQLEKNGSSHVSMPIHKKSLKTFFLSSELAKHIEDISPDIVHVRSRMPAWVNFFALKKLKNKPICVSTFHGLYSFPTYSQVMSFTDHSIAISETVKEYMQLKYQIPNEKITVIPRGCDMNVFNNNPLDKEWIISFLKQFPSVADKKILTMPTRITRWKGVDTFVKLLSQLDDTFIGLIVGPVSKSKKRYLKELKFLIAKLKCENKIIFTDSRNDISNIYKFSDLVFNLSSSPEPFGRTMIEAISCGTKVVAWNHGGANEILSTLFPEGLVKLNDVIQLQETVENLIKNKDLQPSENIFTVSRMTSETIDLYSKLLKN